MARARNIKPSFFLNEFLVELDPIYRLLFIGLWTLADREGRIENRPKKIKMELFPADDIKIQDGLENLHKTGFIQLYNCYGTGVIQIINFSKHQKPHGLEKDSDLPNADGMFTVYPRNEKNKTVNGEGVLHGYESWCLIKGIEINQAFIENNDNNCYETVLEQTNNALNPECGILNPDMLNPDCGYSEKQQHTHNQNHWHPNMNNLETILKMTKHSQRVNEILGMEDFNFHLGNFNAHHEKNIQLSDNQRTRKFSQWLIQEFEKQDRQKQNSNYQQRHDNRPPDIGEYMRTQGADFLDVTPQQNYLEHKE